MGVLFTNNASTTLSSAISSTSATSISVASSSTFPAPGAGEYFYATIDDATNIEIVKVTAVSGTTWTVVRGSDDTTARTFANGTTIQLRAAAALLTDIQQNIAAKSANQTVYNATTASSATTYSVGVDPQDEANAMVFLNGVMQHHDTFSFSGSTLTFDAAPSDGLKLEVIVDNLINLQSSNLTVDTFTATNGQTAFTLSDTPAAEDNLIVFIEGVFQNQDSYSISTNTLTMSAGVTTGRKVVVYVINPVNIGTPSDGTVTSAKLSGNITTPGTLTVGSYDVAFDSPTFFVDNSNSRVGLGTATPSVPVDIVGDVKMSSTLELTSHLDMPDNAKILLGTGDDLQIYHDGSYSYIKDGGTGDLRIQGSTNVQIYNADLDKLSANFHTAGPVTLYYDNAAKLATASGGVTVTGTLTATTLAGTLSTAAQTAITSVGTLTTLNTGLTTVTTDGSGYAIKLVENSGSEHYQIGVDSYGGLVFYNETTKVAEFTDSSSFNTYGNVVINEDSADVDFRVESNGLTHALFVDGGNDTVGIGAASSAAPFQVSASPSDTVGTVGISLKDVDNAIEFGLRLDATSKDLHIDRYYSGSWHNHMSFDRSSGNVGIGTATPGYPLHVAGSTIGLFNTGADAIFYLGEGEGGGAYAKIYWKASDDTLRLGTQTGGDTITVNESGNVGIGTTSPDADLHLYATADDRPHLKLEGYKNHGTDDAPIIEFYTNDETTGGISDNTVVGNIAFYGDEKDGGTKELYAQIRGIAHDPGQGSSNKGKLQFRTQSAGDISGTMTIDESSVGINNDDPAAALHVKQSGSAFIRVDCGGGTSDSGFEIYQNGTRKWEIVNDDSESDPLDIRTSGGAGGSGLRIAQTGNVGIQIGNNVPASPLHVLAGSTGSNPYIATAITMAPSNFPARTWQLRMDDGGAAGYGFSIAAADNRILYLNNNNRVGINEVSPDTTFHVTGADGIRNERAGAGVYDMSIDNTVTGDAADLNFIAQTNDTGYFFRTRKSDGNLKSAFSISANGHIGFGHADPEPGMDSSSYTQIKLGCGQIGDSGDSSGGNTYIANNLYSGASNDMKFRYAVPASMISLTGGDIRMTTNDGGGASADATASMTTRFFIKENGLTAVGAHTPVGKFDIRDPGGAAVTPTTTTPLLFTGSNSGSTCHHEFKVDHNSGVEVQRFINSNGQQGHIKLNSSATAFSTSSDYRLKENVEYTWDATTRLKQLKPARFSWIADDTNTLEDGFLAHEVSNIVPNAISGEKDAVMPDDSIDPQAIDQSKLVPLMVKTIQELEARIEALENG